MKRHQHVKHWRGFGIVLTLGTFMLGGLAGCVLSPSTLRTDGETPRLMWRATNFRHYTLMAEAREIYQFTLVLQETQGKGLTLTALEATLQNNPISHTVNWKRAGSWQLKAYEELRLPMGSYRSCPSRNCIDFGPFEPIWNLTLTGVSPDGAPIRETIAMQLPRIEPDTQ